MSPDKTTENIARLHKKVTDLLRQGKSESYIVDELRKDGINLDYAQIIIANVHNDIHDRKSFWKLIFGGLFFIVGGWPSIFFPIKLR